jgi:hypothetical protein
MRHHSGMMRVVVGLAAWVAGTAIAVSVAWFGANVVLADAGAGQGVPVINAAPLTPVTPATVTPAAVTGAGAGTAAPSASSAAGEAASTPPSQAVPAVGGSTAAHAPTSPTVTAGTTDAAGGVHDYTLTGGRVTLDMTKGAVQLVAAVPDTGYSVQTWSGTGWLRVDFSSGPQVSSLIASWYQHAPSITVEN